MSPTGGPRRVTVRVTRGWEISRARSFASVRAVFEEVCGESRRLPVFPQSNGQALRSITEICGDGESSRPFPQPVTRTTPQKAKSLGQSSRAGWASITKGGGFGPKPKRRQTDRERTFTGTRRRMQAASPACVSGPEDRSHSAEPHVEIEPIEPRTTLKSSTW